MSLSRESGKWRNYEEITVNHTLISKDWSYGGKDFRELVLVPYGIQDTIIRLFNNSRNTVWNTIREEVKVILYYINIESKHFLSKNEFIAKNRVKSNQNENCPFEDF